MGKHRLRLSDMNMPINAWFCKLKYMMSQPQRKLQPTNKTTSNPQPQSPPKQLQPHRASSSSPSPLLHPKAFDTRFPLDSPRKSTSHKPPRRIPPAIVTSSSSSSSSLSFSSSSCRGSVSDSDSDVQSSHCITKRLVLSNLHLELPPIITKPALTTNAKEISSTTVDKPKKAAPATRRLRTRTLASAKKKKKNFAVVKSSSDPRSDFRESMAEMVLENGLTSSAELQDLLACYLSLNSNDYHHLIVEVFEEIVCFRNPHPLLTQFVSKY